MTGERGVSAVESAEDEHALVGAYALNAVAGAERSEFERHLAGCPLCTADVPAFREVIAGLARSTATTPPDTLVDETVARARSVPQERARRRRLWSMPRRRAREG
ncbi:zf-HC2 domain-containing protein [Actinospica durhamensis]|uniref:Zf-HC2 domain-containing protein n=1 Tax=Actinospica durhamensis TaxID=1508375 RepID=A0A941EXN9_9ACTN|nr:zf-HC2 domain-containing protein [Actinospica durhamensis]MBR7838237.1 zf-HC2 domain-containing protein [Actinospica durhamensis]